MQFTRLHPNDRFIHDNLTYMLSLAPELNEYEWVLLDQLKDAEAANMYASRTNLPLYLVHEIIEGEVGEDRKHNSFTKV